MAANTTWRSWLRARLDDRRWRPAELIRASGGRLESSQVTRWLRTGQAPSFDSVRAVCAALDEPVVDGLVAAGLIDPGEVGGPVTVQAATVEDASHDALLGELARRLAQTSHGAAIRSTDVPLEWSKGDAPSRRRESKERAKRA